MTSLEESVSARISILRSIMIAGIVLLHVPPYVPLGEVGDGVFAFFKAFVSGALFRASVPVLTCISGFLLFRSCLDQKILLLLSKKVHRLLVPMLLANLPLVLLLHIAQANGYFQNLSVQLYPLDLFTLLDKSVGLVSEPVNYPLKFLRDLIVLSLLAPVLGFFLREMPRIGLGLVGLVFLLGADGPIVLRDTMLVNFYIGGLIAVKKWDLTKLDKYAAPSLIVLLGMCAVIVEFEIEDRRMFSILSPFLIWPISSLFVGTSIGELCRKLAPHSFFVFLIHAPVLMLVWLMYQRLDLVPYKVFWVLAPIVTISICLAGSKAMNVLPPLLNGILRPGKSPSAN